MLQETDTTAIAGNQKERLAECAADLHSQGLKVYVDNVEYSGQTQFTDDSQLQVKLGVGSQFETTGGNAYLVAFETPDPASDEFDPLTTAATNAGCTPLLNRLGMGWVETGEGDGQVHILALPAKSDGEFETIIRTLPARSAVLDGKLVADLQFAKLLTVAPSKVGKSNLRRLNKDAAGPSVVTASEAFGLGVVLDESSEVRDHMTRTVHDVRANNSITNLVRDKFNRTQVRADVLKSLDEQGWTKLASDAFATSLIKANESGETQSASLIHDTLSLVVGADLKDTGTQVLRPFDLLVGTTRPPAIRNRVLGGSPEDEVLETAERVAGWLLERSIVTLDVEVFAARGDRHVIKKNQDTLAVIKEYAERIRSARSNQDASTPLAFLKTAMGNPEAVASISPAGELIRWTKETGEDLLQAAAQLATLKTDKEGMQYVVEYHHGVQQSVVRATMSALMRPGTLAPVEYYAREPIITREGLVVQRHGYDADAHTFLSIPHRERAMWRTRYTVPTRPTKEQVQAAWDFMMTEMANDFPWETPTDQARFGAYLLTAAGRSLTNGSIAFAFDAPSRGTGKSESAAVGRVLGQGHGGSSEFYFGLVNDAETNKTVAAMSLAGKTFLHNDEAPDVALKSKVIQVAVTAVDGSGSLRVLGVSKEVARSGLIVTTCGGHIKIGGDLNRRFLHLRMAVPLGQRVIGRSNFRHPNLLKWVQANRPELLAAAHTILLYGLQNLPAHELTGMNMAHDWPEKILGPMTHSRIADGLTAAEAVLAGWLQEIDDEDELGAEWGELLAHLWKYCLGESKTAADLAGLAKTYNPGLGEEKPALPGALLASANAKYPGKEWAAAIRTVDRNPIPFQGLTFTIAMAEKRKQTRHASVYNVECWRDGIRIIPGRDPHADNASVDDSKPEHVEATLPVPIPVVVRNTAVVLTAEDRVF